MAPKKKKDKVGGDALLPITDPSTLDPEGPEMLAYLKNEYFNAFLQLNKEGHLHNDLVSMRDNLMIQLDQTHEKYLGLLDKLTDARIDNQTVNDDFTNQLLSLEQELKKAQISCLSDVAKSYHIQETKESRETIQHELESVHRPIKDALCFDAYVSKFSLEEDYRNTEYELVLDYAYLLQDCVRKKYDSITNNLYNLYSTHISNLQERFDIHNKELIEQVNTFFQNFATSLKSEQNQDFLAMKKYYTQLVSTHMDQLKKYKSRLAELETLNLKQKKNITEKSYSVVYQLKQPLQKLTTDIETMSKKIHKEFPGINLILEPSPDNPQIKLIKYDKILDEQVKQKKQSVSEKQHLVDDMSNQKDIALQKREVLRKQKDELFTKFQQSVYKSQADSITKQVLLSKQIDSLISQLEFIEGKISLCLSSQNSGKNEILNDDAYIDQFLSEHVETSTDEFAQILKKKDLEIETLRNNVKIVNDLIVEVDVLNDKSNKNQLLDVTALLFLMGNRLSYKVTPPYIDHHSYEMNDTKKISSRQSSLDSLELGVQSRSFNGLKIPSFINTRDVLGNSKISFLIFIVLFLCFFRVLYLEIMLMSNNLCDENLVSIHKRMDELIRENAHLKQRLRDIGI